MSNLEDFIKQHRSEFEQDSLPEGHWERFNQRLDAAMPTEVQPKKRRNLLFLWTVSAVAACIALFLIFSPKTEENGETDPMILQAMEISREFNEVQFYYTMQMEQILSEMEQIHQAENTEASLQLLSESKRIMQQNIHFEQEIAPHLPCSSDGLNTINLYYQCSLGSMEQMLARMKQLNSTNH